MIDAGQSAVGILINHTRWFHALCRNHAMDACEITTPLSQNGSLDIAFHYSRVPLFCLHCYIVCVGPP